MRRGFNIILLSLIGLGLLETSGVEKAWSIPKYYTFEGTIKQIVDYAGYVQAAGIAMGDTVSYTFLIDFGRQGESTFMNGNVQVHDDVGPLINGYEGNWDRIYVDYLSGDAFAVKFTDIPYADNDWKQHNFGDIQDWGDTGGVYFDAVTINAGWLNERLLMHYIPAINSWQLDLGEAFEIGALWSIENQIDTLSRGHSLVRADLTLVTISSDNDGISDDDDACPTSDLSDTVVIEGCDAGVENTLLVEDAEFGNGCTIADLIMGIAADAPNHTLFVSGVSHLTNDLKKAGIITGKQQGAIQGCAARANIP